MPRYNALMLRGHVDLISPELIVGWAVDDEHPASPVDVSIFLDGLKIAQVSCDQPRHDLRQQGTFGDGRHGFRHKLSLPLSSPAPKHVEVRHAVSGRLLGRGDQLLADGVATSTNHARAELPEEYLVIPAPTTPREMMNVLTLYEEQEGIFDLLRQLDFSDRTARQVAYAALGDYGEGSAEPTGACPWLARDLMNNLLHSDAFQRNILGLILDAFPEKRRLLFVHIPKCAGSDLSHHLMGRYASIYEQWRSAVWFGRPQLWEAVSRALQRFHFSESVFVRGHINLTYYIEQHLIRPCDQVFTIVRQPLEVALSQVNYILTRLSVDAELGAFGPDTKDWLRLLAVEAAPADITPSFLEDMRGRLLRNTQLVRPNSLCHWLGGGDAEAVMGRLAAHGVEVTNTDHYGAWLRERWGIKSRTRRNESVKFLTINSLTNKERSYLTEASVDDMRFYEAVEKMLATSGTNSIQFGLEP